MQRDSYPTDSIAPTPEVQGAANISLVLEVLFGLFGILGVGHAYSGRVALGIALMVGWWAYILVAAFIVTVSFGVLSCLMIPIYIAVPIISGLYARTYVLRTGTTGNWISVAAVGGGGCLAVILLVLISVLALGSLAALLPLIGGQR